MSTRNLGLRRKDDSPDDSDVIRMNSEITRLKEHIADVEGEAAYSADLASRLWLALRDVLPETCASHATSEPGCPDCSAIALLVETEAAAKPKEEEQVGG